jgi:8-amino-7-oxononanoate synthase
MGAATVSPESIDLQTPGVATVETGAVPQWESWVEEACAAIETAGQWRRPQEFDALGPAGRLGVHDGVPVVSFASNDYLGLSSHPAVVAAAGEALARWGSGSGASRLITGTRPVHSQLEEALAAWKGSSRAVLFPTGFAANLAVLSVFGAADAHVFSDERNHASIIDGCRLARAGFTVYPHLDLAFLEKGLASCPSRPIIVSDTVFSMDGDEVDVDRLMAVAERHDALLILDEAHAVLGPEVHLPAANGSARQLLRVGTLSKTLGSLGGFVAGPARFMELLVNRARPYIFTTAPPPSAAAAALAALEIVRSGEGEMLRDRLSSHVDKVTEAVGLSGHRSPIIPVIVGDEADAVAASKRLLAEGLWIPAIRPPTVAPGTSRLRVTLSAIHRDEHVARLVAGLRQI